MSTDTRVSVPPAVRDGAPGGLFETLRSWVPELPALALSELQRRIEDRVARIPTEMNEYGYDGYGLSRDFLTRTTLPTAWLYENYFRVETHDIERVPSGPVMLVANHAGQLPFDAAMLGMAMLLDADPPRVARGMAEYWVSTLPFVSELAVRSGSMVGTPGNCTAMLRGGECVMVFPEGVRGMNKTFSRRYELQRFGTGFARLALEAGAPVVPVAIIGSEEQQPGLLNLESLGRAIGMPALPVTLGFPWLGPLGLLPMPVKYRIYFGEPLFFEGNANDEDRVIDGHVASVKRSIEALFARGLKERTGVFT